MVQTPPDGPPTAVPPAGPAVPRNRQWRLVLALVGGVLALLCLGGGVVAFTLYDNATKLDRSSPVYVASEYTSELFVHRDRPLAGLWACDDADLAAAERILDDIIATERRLNTSIRANTEAFKVRKLSDTRTEIRMEVRRTGTVDGVRQSTTEPLTVIVEDRDGWRVCAASAP